MSQEQPRRTQSDPEPTKYGVVFNVSNELTEKPIASLDASMKQTAESTILGQTQKSGPVCTMLQASADQIEGASVVGHVDVSDVARAEGVTVTETDVPGYRTVTESVGGQVVDPYGQSMATALLSEVSALTIEDALEATAKILRHKTVDQRDAAAIQAAEARATGSNVVTPGGLAAMAQSTATFNYGIDLGEKYKFKLGDILTGATTKLPVDKAATRQDAEVVENAEMQNNPNQTTQPGGVAASVKAAARLNETGRI
ncbi:late embryogenesis abundant protein D-34-like [Humulus lupulus]|uniref:late embryogenesis abundant protein D-34-like n=1 Tax=Humulus lupulus TaxID=3486 RepID=UPI002B408725|nr:late embryogenesis abundant protein D-34-like [Humulus lupulus]